MKLVEKILAFIFLQKNIWFGIMTTKGVTRLVLGNKIKITQIVGGDFPSKEF